MTEPVTAKHSAFVVANDAYADPKLRQLRAPSADAEELGRVLRDPEIGGFDVDVSMNEPEHVVRRKLSAFFDNRGLDDLLVLHLSCHGLKDDDGRLYFATADTELDHLEATAIPSEFVNRQMTRSRSRRIVLLLDCCYSGAFAAGMLSRSDQRVEIKERFDGRGRVVLTASSAMEYSFEGDQLEGEGKPSVFTSALVRGLATGVADRNQDGWISIDELYDYAYDEVRAVTPSQTPGKWVFDVQGDLYIARSRVEPPPVEEPALPADLVGAVTSPYAHVRAGAAQELGALLDGPDEAVAALAGDALAKLALDDSRRVTDAVARALGEPEPPPEISEAPVAPAPRPAPAPAPAPADLPVPDRAAVLARGGAAAMLAAFVIPILASAYEGWNLFAVLSPFEAGATALVTWRVARGLRSGRVSASLAAGVLIALGVLTTVASLALVKFSLERINAVATVLVVVVLGAAVAILAAGVICLRSSPRSATVAPLDPGTLMLGLGGAALASIALFVPYDGFSSLWSEVAETTSAEFFFEPFAAIAVTLTGLSALGTRLRFASGMLLAAGAAATLHFLGVIVAAWQAIGEPGAIKSAGFVGIVGGLLVVAAGANAYRQGPAG